MAITDLTNTVWVFNGSLARVDYIFDYEFNIYFTNGYRSACSKLKITNQEFGGYYWYINYYNFFSKSYYSQSVYRGSNGWSYDYTTAKNNGYRIVHILGGTDATNNALIEFLQTYAVQVPTASLLNTKWILNDALNLPTASNYQYYGVNFYSGIAPYTKFTYFLINCDGNTESGLHYVGQEIYYKTTIDASGTLVYLTEPQYYNENYKTIYFFESYNIYPDLLVWLSQNATFVKCKKADLGGLDLTAGSYTTKAKARATGFTDSAFSNSISYTKSNIFNNITIDVTTEYDYEIKYRVNNGQWVTNNNAVLNNVSKLEVYYPSSSDGQGYITTQGGIFIADIEPDEEVDITQYLQDNCIVYLSAED